MEKTCPQVLSVYKYELLQRIIAPILETPFFFISNVKILLIIKDVPNRVHWGCTIGAQIRNQKYNDQEKQEKKNKKNEKNHTPIIERVQEERLNL